MSYFRENWCPVADAYACKAINNRTDWLAHQKEATDQNTCTANCFPKDLWACYNDGGKNAPVQVTTLAQWNTLKKAGLPDSVTFVKKETDCTIPQSGKWWCDSSFNCGQVKTWADYEAHMNDTFADSCDDCYPKGKYWCDKTSFTCTSINSRALYLAHKDAILDDCSTCFPTGEFWCMDDYTTCDAIADQPTWEKVRKTKGSRSTDCETCYPKGQYWCDSAKKCNAIETYADWKRASGPIYTSEKFCSKNCKGGTCWWLWILLILLVLGVVGVIVYFVAKRKKKRPAWM